ncbi:grasp-with-spasm system ATP-grasp peptide maturase [Chitinophaga polysaccharea]|uniref:grasp-with-spasm system ATP-grasp peptide maturase n=1 Tax=Chitinophaga polysaccharea TaxID=1293035 RepID=UPI001157D4C8|nr:grasp-with-spasm system ATP-grasp peptide maturase [Chitinophaga polysaccharea]
MILIISRVGHTVNKVMDWLNYYKQPYIRFSDADNLYELLDIEISDHSFSVRIKKGNVDIDLYSINAVWVWHGDIRFKGLSLSDVSRISKKEEVTQNLQSQIRTVYGFIENYLISKRIIGHTFLQDVNKLTLLSYARQVGLHIPQTYVSTKTSHVQQLTENNELITKSIQQSPFIHDSNGNVILKGYTTEVFHEQTKKIAQERLFPSLLQEKLDKKYELRIFYLDGKCYPMAIFSQRDEQTAIDFRKYNHVKPNRMMSCSIPDYLEKQIIKLMKMTGLNTGSLDFVKTKDNKYVFLEVNPVGQFGFVSESCNYQLEKLIAEKLVSYC